MSQVILNATARDKVGSKGAKKLRREGKVPGIYYAHNEKNIPFVVDERELRHLLGIETALIDLKIGKGRAKKCVLKDVHLDPLTNRPLHIDMQGVKMKERIHVTVPVHIVGEAVGVKTDGGILNQMMHELEVSCLPGDLPENIVIDVSELRLGESIHVKDVNVENVEILNDEEVVIVNIVASRASKEVTTEPGEEEAEEEEKTEGEE